MISLFERVLRGGDGAARLSDPAAAREHAHSFARLAAFAPPEVRAASRYVLTEAAYRSGAYPASIEPFYIARGRGEVGGFTIPAVNVRGLTFDTARALFRAIRATAGVAIFEINRAEIRFTAQEPAEFAAMVLGAALAEGYHGPVFIQGDHFQANAKAYRADPGTETGALEALVREAVAAEFYCIDIDASTLVDLSQPTVPLQQEPNAALTARLASIVRAVQAPGVSVSIGGEIGEVGEKNSTVEELVAYVKRVAELTPGGRHGLAKVSVQTGTSHGGMLLPDGSVADVALDFGTLEELSRVARERFGMAGAVQHGASTLPEEFFGRFPETETAEVHLATSFQNIVFDHPAFPVEMRAALEARSLAAHAAERTPGETDFQLHYRVRKNHWGPLKRELWSIEQGRIDEMMAAVQERFEYLVRVLGAAGRMEDLLRYVRPYVRPDREYAGKTEPLFTFASDDPIYGG